APSGRVDVPDHSAGEQLPAGGDRLVDLLEGRAQERPEALGRERGNRNLLQRAHRQTLTATGDAAPCAAAGGGEQLRPLLRSEVLEAWTRRVIRHRRITLIVWLALLVFGVYGAANVGKLLSNRFSVPGSDAEEGLNLVKDRLNERSDGAFTLILQ